MKFKPPKDEDLMLSLTTGHTFVVKKAGSDVPDAFIQAAVAAGCAPVRKGGKSPADSDTQAEASRPDLIRGAMEKMLDSDDEGNFTADNKPELAKLSDIAGFKVSRDERDALWAELSAALKLDAE